MKKLWGLVTLLLIVSVIGLFVLAFRGNPIALIIIGAMGAAVLMFLGAGLVIVYQRSADNAEQRRFRDNAIENLRITQEAQKAQNLMMQGVQRQMKNYDIAAQNNGSQFLIDNGIFEEIE